MNELVGFGRKALRAARHARRRRWPALWRLFRGPLRAQFDALAPAWDGILGPEALAPLAAALDRLDARRRVLDVGTGTGNGARLVAERFPQAEVLGVDLAPAMVEEARRLLPPSSPAGCASRWPTPRRSPSGARRSTSSSSST